MNRPLNQSPEPLRLLFRCRDLRRESTMVWATNAHNLQCDYGHCIHGI
jgi:hypothetical protein